MQARIKGITEDPYYIASPNLLSRLEWRRAPGGVSKLFPKVPKSEPDSEEEPKLREPAELRFFGVVDDSPVNFYLLPDGGWSPKSRSAFHAQKATAVIQPPDEDEPGADHWPSIAKAALEIMRSKKTPGAGMGYGLGKNGGLKVRHALFQRIEPANDSGSNDENIVGTGKPSTGEDNNSGRGSQSSNVLDDGQLLLANWPTTSPEAKAQLECLISEGKWEANPLAAYDRHGNLIHPTEYGALLRGAFVEVKVHIVHQHIAQSNTNNYYADIQEMRIIMDKPLCSYTPIKKRIREELTRASRKRMRTEH
ncbi:hypothetical protein K474DRAFT_1757199 [Panus rudis PR-1116 ss-1]|nr:hypothetical protein K474DRAFT_1757199 [Panus rudis PR-1116 ss-1]